MRSLVMSLALLFSGLAYSTPTWEAGPNGEIRHIIILKKGSDPVKFAAQLGLKPEKIWRSAFDGLTVLSSDRQLFLSLRKLRNNVEVDIIEIDREVKLLEPTVHKSDISITKQQTPWGIKRVGSFKCSKSCKKRRAWVIDTGIDVDHPDLQVYAKKGFSAFGGSVNDDHGHGTHVAGTIGAKKNKIGVVGVAANAILIPVKVLDRRGRGSTSGVIAGINHVAKYGKPGDVANMSLGGGASKALDQAVLKASQKGILFTLAAGNSGRDANTSSPARVNGKNIFTISAFDEKNRFARFSNFGTSVDKSEPGVSILSTVPNGKYAIFSGTSMAAPHAAGILLKKSRFDKSCNEVIGDPDNNTDCIGLLP
jgi:hypothetical protein